MAHHPDRQISDALFELLAIFADRRRQKRGFNDEELGALERVCSVLGERAVILEDEVSRLRIAVGEARSFVDVDALLREVRRPGTNVTLLGLAPRRVPMGAA